MLVDEFKKEFGRVLVIVATQSDGPIARTVRVAQHPITRAPFGWLGLYDLVEMEWEVPPDDVVCTCGECPMAWATFSFATALSPDKDSIPFLGLFDAVDTITASKSSGASA